MKLGVEGPVKGQVETADLAHPTPSGCFRCRETFELREVEVIAQ